MNVAKHAPFERPVGRGTKRAKEEKERDTDVDRERGREEKRADPAERARRVSPGEERDRTIEGNARRKERESNRGDDAGAREARRPHGFLNRRGHTSRYVRFTYPRGSIITGQTGFPIHEREREG